MQQFKQTVVIVNARPSDAERYAGLLRSGLSDDLEIVTASDVEDGLVQCQGCDPYCILLDHEPPDVDGLVFIAGLKFSDPSPPPPIVMIAGDGAFNVAIEPLKRSVDDYLSRDEVNERLLVRAVRNAVEKASLRRELSEARAELARVQLYDHITGLASQQLFNDRVEHAVELAARINDSVCLLVIDVEGLASVHDQLGRIARDRALREIARRLSSVARKADTIARLGDGEFAVLMETGATSDGAARLAEKIIEVVAQPMEFDDTSFTFGVSIGVSMLTGESGDLIVRRVDAVKPPAAVKRKPRKTARKRSAAG